MSIWFIATIFVSTLSVYNPPFVLTAVLSFNLHGKLNVLRQSFFTVRVSERHPQIDYLNEIRQDTPAYEDTLFSNMCQQYEYRLKYEAVPVAVPPELGKVRYFDLDNESQKNFASLVTRGQEHYLIKSLGIAEHLAKLLLMHPTTTHLARKVLISSNIPNLARFSKPSSD